MGIITSLFNGKNKQPTYTGENTEPYLKHELIRFPCARNAQDVYDKAYLKELSRCLSDIEDRLPKPQKIGSPVPSEVTMKGIILGDMYGSPFEVVRENAPEYKIADISLPSPGIWTDDTIMSIASLRAAKEILIEKTSDKEAVRIFAKHYRDLARQYPHAGYGGRFYDWAVFMQEDPSYMSYGDGSAMRAGIIATVAPNLKSCIRLAALSALPTHAHPEGIKGAVCTAIMTFYARNGYRIQKGSAAQLDVFDRIAGLFYPHGATSIEEYNDIEYGYLSPVLTLHEIRQLYPKTLSVTCQVAVPLAISLARLSGSYTDFVKHLSMLPMDADTVGAIAGGFIASWRDDGYTLTFNLPPEPKKEQFDNSADIQPEEIRDLFLCLKDNKDISANGQDYTAKQTF